MSVVEEIRNEQKKALSTMTFREKLSYFWYYYKIHTAVVLAVVAFAALFIYQYVTNKDYGFYAAFVNAQLTYDNADLAAEWAKEFQTYAQIDPDEYQVYLDTSIALSQDMGSQDALSNQEKMLAMLQAGIVHAIVAETETFEKYAQNEYFYDLETLFSEEELAKYGAYFYYTDASTFADGSDDTFYAEDELTDPADLVIDHRDPASMERPVAVGIVLTEDNLLAEAGYYDYLSAPEQDYQGYPSDIVLGIPVTCKEPELAVRFLAFIKLNQSPAS